MKSSRLFAVVSMIFTSVSCHTVPNRPDAPICGVTTEGAQCVDVRGDFNDTHANMLCTTLEGYSKLESYIDTLELRVRDYERRCGKKKKVIREP